MEERGNKTIICSVFFLDIVEYSKKSVSEQISLKERFNAFLSKAIRDVPLNDRIILDTGDGAAVTFLGDIEDALQAALSMRSDLLGETAFEGNQLLVRMGINLGPARLVKDLNGQPNIVGDGINVAQRVMGFSDAGQILVSRSYYDAVSRISEDFAGLFHYQGSKTDKHVREHEVYAIGYPGEMTDKLAAPASPPLLVADLGQLGSGDAERSTSFPLLNAARLREPFDRLMAVANAGNRRLQIGVAVGLVVLFAIIWRAPDDHTVPSEPTSSTTEAALPVPQSAVVSTPPAAVEVKPEPKTTQSAAVVKEPVKVAPVVETKKDKEKNKPGKAPEVVNAVDNAVPAEKPEEKNVHVIDRSAAMAFVMLSVKPWGEVYVDGKKLGVSPPLTELELVAGNHEVVIRNTTFPELRKSVNLNAGEKISIRHLFN